MTNYTIGNNAVIEQGVVLGYPTGRKIKNVSTSIGNNAFIRSNTVIYTNVTVGDNLETGHNVVIREENILGNEVNIWNNSCIDYGCVIGNNVKIHNNVYVAQFTMLEDDVFLAPGVMIANDLCPVCTECMKGPTIKKGARIGVNVTLLPHITIGEHSVIGAGSVVTKDIPSGMLAYGSPAREIKKITDIKCKFGIVEVPYEQQ